MKVPESKHAIQSKYASVSGRWQFFRNKYRVHAVKCLGERNGNDAARKRKVMESRRRTAINAADICFPLSSCWDTPSNIEVSLLIFSIYITRKKHMSHAVITFNHADNIFPPMIYVIGDLISLFTGLLEP